MALLGREKEFARIESLLHEAIQSTAPHKPATASNNKSRNKPLSIYVSGMPGTGKTATVRAVVEHLSKSAAASSVEVVVRATQSQGRGRKRKRSSQCDTGSRFDFIAIDCFASSTPTGLFREILEKMDLQPGAAGRLAVQLNQAFAERRRPLILLLDEIDNLVAKSSRLKDALLQRAFEWPTTSSGSVILVGIANSLDLTERLLPKLRRNSSGATHAPELVTFAPYTQQQLSAILQARFRDTGADAGMDARAIALCAKKVSAMTGDVRRAFQIAAQTLQSMRNEDGDEDGEEESCPPLLNRSQASEKENSEPPLLRLSEVEAEVGKRTPQKLAATPLKRVDSAQRADVTPAKTGSQTKNACREVLRSIEKVSSSPMQRAKLPFQAQIVLAALMHLIACSTAATTSRWANRRPPTTRDKLLRAYDKICTKLSLIAMGADEMASVLSILESQGMISLSKKGGRALGSASSVVIAFEVEFSEARRVINDPKAIKLLADVESVAL